MTLVELNALDDEAFTATVGPVFEDSPWIAGAAAHLRPFPSIETLEAALTGVLRDAENDRKIALICAHPDLAGRVAREGRLTPASRTEQASAQLDQLTDAERARFDALNTGYRKRFGFPFVICVREQTKASILAAMERRIDSDRGAEIETALREIERIARLRLHDLVQTR
jgi:2-oxo-4-hydroxy-4-carboxy-5-ureidoimidazoline decarboxylase